MSLSFKAAFTSRATADITFSIADFVIEDLVPCMQNIAAPVPAIAQTPNLS